MKLFLKPLSSTTNYTNYTNCTNSTISTTNSTVSGGRSTHTVRNHKRKEIKG